MTIHLPQEVENSIMAQVHSGHFASVDDAMTQAARLLLQQLEQSRQSTAPAIGEAKEVAPPKAIWDVFEEITASIPEAEWAKLPTDGAEQHDHYIYGTPKRPAS